MSEPRIIKRYANRKLYDTQHSRYVTLDQIAEMIRDGDDVKIVDNKTKEDLTSVTLAQIIFEEEKKQKSFLPLQAMRNIIQSGGESVTQFFSEAKGKMTKILPRKGPLRDEQASLEDEPPEEEEAEEPPVAEAGPTSDEEAQGGRPRRGEGLATLRELREWLLHSQRTIDDWQRKVDWRIRHVVEGISPFAGLQKELSGLASRIGELDAKLREMTRREPAEGQGDEPEPEDEAGSGSGAGG